MGRKSREKRERREREASSPVSRVLDELSTDTVLPVLEAASVSPGAAHRGPSISSLFRTAVRRRHTQGRPAAAEDLPALVDAAAEEHAHALTMMEDFAPYDARSEVLVRWERDLFRLIPGSLERPTAVVNQHARLAFAIDPFLASELGFGIGDVAELTLRRLDAVAAGLAPHWGEAPAAEVGSRPSVSAAEVAAACSLPGLPDVVDACANPARAQAVAERFVRPANKLSFDPSHPTATFGPAIGVRSGSQSVWLPAGILVEALPAIGAYLAEYAADRSEQPGAAFSAAIANHVGRLLQGSGHRIAGPVRVGDGVPIHSLATFDERLVLALDVVAGLTPAAIQGRLDQGAAGLASIQPGVEVRNPATSWRIAPDAKIVRVQIVAGPMHASPLGAHGPMMSVEDLEWILYSSQRSSEDLWYFVRDLEYAGGIDRMFAWDLIDRWEVWKPQKSFYRGGLPITSMMFSPHAAVAEWQEAAASSPVERALHQLSLPPLRSWPIVALDHRNGTEVGDLRTDHVYQVFSWDVPVAVAKVDANAPSEHFSTLWNLAVGLAWKLEHSADAFVVAASESGLRSLRIEFEYQERVAGPALSTANVDETILTIGWDDRLLASVAENSLEVEALCGQCVASVLTDSAQASFLTAWESAPPGLRADGYSVRQQAQQLPEPVDVHEAVQSAALRKLGEHLAEEQIQPSQLHGADATRFESQTVFPWLIRLFHQSVAPLRADDLLAFALEQLERANHQRHMIDRQLSWERGFPVRKGEDDGERRERVSQATRAISFIVEEVLAHPPAGDATTDELSWIEALSIAHLCIDSCLRSDAIHFQLTRTSVEISSLYEVTVVASTEPTDTDARAYSDARSTHMLPRGVPISTGSEPEPDPADEEPRAVVELMPDLFAIDAAMKGSLSFGIDAITGALNVATQFAATSDAPATATTHDEFVQECMDLAVGATADEFAAALDWLTLRGEDLAADVIPHWETERRAKRIATSPFVLANDRIWVLPWTSESTLKIFANYLGDGRLPWPATALPREVAQALDQHRQRQNRQLEKDCVEALEAPNLIVQGGIKPEKADHFGITDLAGEIDALCLDVQRSRVWVIEAKDPYTPYSARQIRGLTNDFLGSGGYVDKLLRKVGDVDASAASIATALGATEPARQWEVHGLMVTRHLEPAAFAIDPRVAFCIVDDLAAVVDDDRLAGPGIHMRT